MVAYRPQIAPAVQYNVKTSRALQFCGCCIPTFRWRRYYNKSLHAYYGADNIDNH